MQKTFKAKINKKSKDEPKIVYSIKLSEEVLQLLEEKAPAAINLETNELKVGGKLFTILQAPAEENTECYKYFDKQYQFVGSVLKKITLKPSIGGRQTEEQRAKAFQISHEQEKKTINVANDKNKKVVKKPKATLPLKRPEPDTPVAVSSPAKKIKTSPGAINEEHKQLVIQILGIKPLNDVDLEAALKMPINESIKKVLTEVSFAKQNVHYLKQSYYKEIKVYDWPNYTEEERKCVIENATKAFAALGLPETAPERKKLRPPRTSTTLPPSSTSTPTPTPAPSLTSTSTSTSTTTPSTNSSTTSVKRSLFEKTPQEKPSTEKPVDKPVVKSLEKNVSKPPLKPVDVSSKEPEAKILKKPRDVSVSKEETSISKEKSSSTLKQPDKTTIKLKVPTTKEDETKVVPKIKLKDPKEKEPFKEPFKEPKEKEPIKESLKEKEKEPLRDMKDRLKPRDEKEIQKLKRPVKPGDSKKYEPKISSDKEFEEYGKKFNSYYPQYKKSYDDLIEYNRKIQDWKKQFESGKGNRDLSHRVNQEYHGKKWEELKNQYLGLHHKLEGIKTSMKRYAQSVEQKQQQQRS